MEYRKLPRGGEKISVIGMGASVVGNRSYTEDARRGRGYFRHETVLCGTAAGCEKIAVSKSPYPGTVHSVCAG